MSFTATFIAALVILPAIGLVTWAWFAIARVAEESRAFSGFEGMHFEVCPPGALRQAADAACAREVSRVGGLGGRSATPTL